MNKNKRMAIAYETLDIMDAGHYFNQRNEKVDISGDLQAAVNHTVLYKPDDFDKVFKQRDDPERLKDMASVMLGRIEKLLSVAVVHGQTTLVLGAWGCGVFRNDPNDIAAWFAHHILHNDSFKHAFRHIVFAVYDRSEKQVNRQAFQHKFAYNEVR